MTSRKTLVPALPGPAPTSSIGGWARQAAATAPAESPASAWTRAGSTAPPSNRNAGSEFETRTRDAEPVAQPWTRSASTSLHQAPKQATVPPAGPRGLSRRAAIQAERGRDDAQPAWTWRHVVIFTGGLAAALALFFLVRGIVNPASPTPARVGEALPASATFPQTAAASVAERFAEAYFSWNSSAPGERREALRGLVQTGVSSDVGWNGSGDSTGTDARLDSLRILDQSSALATVTVTVTGSSESSAKAATQTIEIPLAAVRERVFVSGLPAAVALASPTAARPQGAHGSVDSVATAATESDVTTFFTAYGKEADLSAVIADGAAITGLGGRLHFDELVSWQAAEGTNTFHTGFATVKWRTGDGASLVQRYRVGLAKTGTASLDWQVLNLDADYTAEVGS